MHTACTSMGMHPHKFPFKEEQPAESILLLIPSDSPQSRQWPSKTVNQLGHFHSNVILYTITSAPVPLRQMETLLDLLLYHNSLCLILCLLLPFRCPP